MLRRHLLMQWFLNHFCAMEPFESLVKPTDLFSEKCIYMHKLEIRDIYCS